MALKYKYATKQEIPAEHQSLYVERDGAWTLDADGIVDKSKHEEFRANNIALANHQLEAILNGNMDELTNALVAAEKELKEQAEIK